LLLSNTNPYKSIYANPNLIKKECYKKYSDTKPGNVEMKNVFLSKKKQYRQKRKGLIRAEKNVHLKCVYNIISGDLNLLKNVNKKFNYCYYLSAVLNE
jgi:hypothetical protein